MSTQKYPRGSRGSPAKGVVWETVARVRIPPSAPKTQRWIFCLCVFLYSETKEGFDGWSRFARAKRFATNCGFTKKTTAKDAIDNGGAGRAAKGENPSFCAKNTKMDFLSLCFFIPRTQSVTERKDSRTLREKSRFALQKTRLIQPGFSYSFNTFNTSLTDCKT